MLFTCRIIIEHEITAHIYLASGFILINTGVNLLPYQAKNTGIPPNTSTMERLLRVKTFKHNRCEKGYGKTSSGNGGKHSRNDYKQGNK